MNAFDAKTHTYTINGKKATGVTSVISVLAKPALIGWAAKCAVEYIRENIEDNGVLITCAAGNWHKLLENAQKAHTKKKEAAGTHGTDAHALVENYVNECLKVNDGKPFAVAPTEIGKFAEWARENVDHFLFSERQMYNRDLFIAGTADFAYIGKDGKKYMADFKTSSGIYGIDYWLQVAAYKMLAEAEGDEPYDGMTVVRLGKKGPSDFETQQLYDYETYKTAFLACLTLYRAQAALAGMVIKGE